MRKNFLILFLVFVYIWSWSIFNAVNAAENKTQAIVGHVITETIRGTDIDSMAILEQELKILMHKSTLDMIKLIENRLPDILEGIAAELRLQSDSKLKCELLKGSPNGCISVSYTHLRAHETR